MILLIDNYDSFAHNLARYLRRLGTEVVVCRNDAAELEALAGSAQAIVISPGPCGPLQAGRCIPLVQSWSGRLPILGICLGHQVICHAMGGNIVRASRPVHGQAFPMKLEPTELFAGIASGTRFARYHSLVADANSLPKSLTVTATCETYNPKNDVSPCVEVMAVQHREHQTFGVQFHPESILSEAGYQLLNNFLKICGCCNSAELPNSDLSDPKASHWNAVNDVADTESEHAAVLPLY